MVFHFFPLEMIYCTFNWWRFPHLLGIQKGFLEAQWPHEYMDPSLASVETSMFWSRKIFGFVHKMVSPKSHGWSSFHNIWLYMLQPTFIYIYINTISSQSRTLPRAPRITLSASAKPKFMGSSTSASVNLIMPNSSPRMMVDSVDHPDLQSQIWGLPCHLRNLPLDF